jgi:hypothetical protein
MNNNQTKEIAQQFINDFYNYFNVTLDSKLILNKEILINILNWYNESYILLELITDIPLFEIFISIDFSYEELKHKYNNYIKYIYSISYLGLIYFSRILKQEIKDNYKSFIEI